MTNEERVQLLITQARNKARIIEEHGTSEAVAVAEAMIDLCDALRQHVATNPKESEDEPAIPPQ